MKSLLIRLVMPLLLVLALPTLSMAQITIDVSVNTPPPELPVYDQPPIPGDGYVWTPGFWSWSVDDQDYYWVPGTWVPAPQPDYLWTPGYWGFVGGAYLWHGGYWGPHVGFYGGVNYGYGYGGSGYEGGYWQGGHLFYNRSVTNVNNVHITNVYNKTVINNVTVNRVSFNGGSGVRATPSAADEAASRERHIEATSQQRAHVQTARTTPALRASQNQGHPAIAATDRPGAFSGAGVVGAKRGGTMSVVPAQHTQPTQRPQPSRPAETQPRNEGQIRGNENSQREGPQRVAPPVQRVNPQPERSNPPEQRGNPQFERGNPQAERGNPQAERGNPQSERGNPQPQRVNPPPQPQQHASPPPQQQRPSAPPQPAPHAAEHEEHERH